MSEKKKITITAGEDEMIFSVSDIDVNTYINSVGESNKVTPSKRFLKTTVTKETEPVLNKYIDKYYLDILGEIIQDYKPKMEFCVKK